MTGFFAGIKSCQVEAPSNYRHNQQDTPGSGEYLSGSHDSHVTSFTSRQSYCLEWYKSMDQKRALLDAALDTFDGNCITTVLLFIRKTLNHRKPQREGGVLAALTHLSLPLLLPLVLSQRS